MTMYRMRLLALDEDNVPTEAELYFEVADQRDLSDAVQDFMRMRRDGNLCELRLQLVTREEAESERPWPQTD
jgi:hypothetical protein